MLLLAPAAARSTDYSLGVGRQNCIILKKKVCFLAIRWLVLIRQDLPPAFVANLAGPCLWQSPAGAPVQHPSLNHGSTPHRVKALNHVNWSSVRSKSKSISYFCISRRKFASSLPGFTARLCATMALSLYWPRSSNFPAIVFISAD